MKVFLSTEKHLDKTTSIALSGSKSESNRLLILQAIYPNLTIENLSSSDDTRVLQHALAQSGGTIDIQHAGTAMRFLTAYFASKPGVEVLITGSLRMQQRPIGILVDALRGLGAQIDYVEEDGYPPLRIVGSQLSESSISVAAGISSQYITALMLVAPSLPNGLKIQLEGKVTSRPYIEMTLALLKKSGITSTFSGDEISISASEKINDTSIWVESDWSSASYFYSLVALSGKSTIELKSFRQDSLQGDSALARIYAKLGVRTTFHASENKIILSKVDDEISGEMQLDLSDTPDIAQTIAVTCLGLGLGCYLTGLHTLKIKETDRLAALKTELEKLGGSVTISENSLRLFPALAINKDVEIATYDDHRMAMAFAPLALKVPIEIGDSEVVSKSYPSFWKDLGEVGIKVSGSIREM